MDNLFYNHTHYVIALSGGVDSVVLTHWLLTNYPEKTFLACYVNHGLGTHNDEWEEFCRKFCDEIGVEFRVLNVNNPEKNTNEAFLREERYKLLLKSNHPVIVAHHADDNFETFFLKLFRGAGTRGLTGLKPVVERNDVEIIRPFLEWTKNDILEYATKNNLKYVTDFSNFDTKFERNWIRHTLKDQIMSRIPRFRIANTIKALSNDRLCLNDLARIDLNLISDVRIARKNLRELSNHRIINMLLYYIEDNGGSDYTQGGLEDFARIIREGRADSRGELKFGTGTFKFFANKFWIEKE